MLPSETMIWQPEFTDKTLSRKPGAVHLYLRHKSFDSRLISCAPYAALASPPCSNSTIRRPISWYVAVINALTLRTVSVRALSTR
ncbi:hypothetical protein RG50_08110 [Escherichia coli]|nr:hypothetical protein RG50_08110 [Escherichia coli]